ncbi:MAG TPA: hypothetical protein VGS19_11565, partial [Streptosporangiaceae bacterium]|nr:hypothetical protein [Streptosporangiaceae bacterium]
PEPRVNGSTATWQEILANSDTPGQTAVGVDHRQQTHDANFTFYAGALLGLGFSVALAGVQLVLPPAAGPGDNREAAVSSDTEPASGRP